jgi:uncharacterized protein YlbG (UPF0298 family)
MTTRLHFKNDIVYSPKLNHSAVLFFSKNRNSCVLLKYSKLFLVRRVRIRKATVSYVMSVILSVRPFIDRKYQGEP